MVRGAGVGATVLVVEVLGAVVEAGENVDGTLVGINVSVGMTDVITVDALGVEVTGVPVVDGATVVELGTLEEWGAMLEGTAVDIGAPLVCGIVVDVTGTPLV